MPSEIVIYMIDFDVKPNQFCTCLCAHTYTSKVIFLLQWNVYLMLLNGEIHSNIMLKKIWMKEVNWTINKRIWGTLKWGLPQSWLVLESIPCFNWFRTAGHLTRTSLDARHWAEPLLGECFILYQWFQITLWLWIRIIYFLLALEINFRLWIFTYHLQIQIKAMSQIWHSSQLLFWCSDD